MRKSGYVVNRLIDMHTYIHTYIFTWVCLLEYVMQQIFYDYLKRYIGVVLNGFLLCAVGK